MFSQLGRVKVIAPQTGFPLWLTGSECKQKSRQNRRSLNEFTEKETI
jgi:hypothetical protein